jgi:predicted lipoprotein with Yx(FWY)xxD motif
MKLKIVFSAVVLALAAASGSAAAEPMPKFTGNLLVDANGMTLYTFTRDVQSKSNCNDSCAAAWPPAAVSSDIERARGDFTVVTRDDGSLQWAHKGRPLYRFAGDARVGDVNGDNQGNVWHVVRTGTAAPAPQTRATGGSMGYSY